MQFLIEQLQSHITQWREGEYSGVKRETLHILKYIISQNYLRKPQISSLETYIYLKEIAKNKPLAEVYMDIIDHKELRKKLFTVDEREEMEDLEKDEKVKLLQERLQKEL